MTVLDHMQKRRSKRGCLTCKLRKKRCDEEKPICGDCRRLNRRCEYITEDMTPEQVDQLKQEMEAIEEESKSRRRRRKGDTDEPRVPRKKRARRPPKDDKVVFNPMSVDIEDVADTGWLQGMGATSESLRYMTNSAEPSGYSAVPVEESWPGVEGVAEGVAGGLGGIVGGAVNGASEVNAIPNGLASVMMGGSTLNGGINVNSQPALSQPIPTPPEPDNFKMGFSPDFLRAVQEHIQGLDDVSFKQLDEEGVQVNAKQDKVLVRRPSGPHFVRNNSIETIHINPSVMTNTTLAYLTPMGQKLFAYYRDKLSLVASSAPKEENMYLNTFLPMAHVDQSVLYGILAWSAFHMGGARMEKQGNYYIQKAIQGFTRRPILDEDTLDHYKDVLTNVDVGGEDDEDVVREETSPFHREGSATLSMLSRDDMINLRLAAVLILCGVEICRGDVTRWSKYLEFGAKLIQLKGGLARFNDSKDEHFLATNYAYHDITAVAVSRAVPLHFELEDYEQMWSASNRLQFLDPLHNISSPVYNLLAEINKLVSTSRRLYRKIRKARSLEPGTVDDSDEETFLARAAEELGGVSTTSPDSNTASYTAASISPDPQKFTRELEEADRIAAQEREEHVDESRQDSKLADEEAAALNSDFSLYERYEQIMEQCQDLENRLNNARPRTSTLQILKQKDLELQLTVFECFQLTAKIHLRQSVLRMTPSSLEIQYLVNQLIKSLDILLGSEVEAALCFPMFVAGMNLIYPRDRREMNQRFNAFVKRYKWKNVLRCQIVVKHLWKLNPFGDKFVDWYDVVRRLGWELSFA